MPGSVRVFIACSLDGFIAGPGDDLSFLPEPRSDGEDYGYAAFMDGVAALLMGRRSYDVVERFGAWPYGDTPVFVATSRPLTPDVATVRPIAGAPRELLEQVRAQVDGGIYLDGGRLIRAFLDAGLIDELIVTIIPTLLGDGVPLFAGVAHQQELAVLDTTRFDDGLVQLRYAVRARA